MDPFCLNQHSPGIQTFYDEHNESKNIGVTSITGINMTLSSFCLILHNWEPVTMFDRPGSDFLLY